ncbi:hypothetical protein B0H14DRAFT_3851626 [Mycena olivaceomarginata]|nr:hypothetical protein B0H14DRAFT_3851626 [Mycena olivaceomarginata]
MLSKTPPEKIAWAWPWVIGRAVQAGLCPRHQRALDDAAQLRERAASASTSTSASRRVAVRPHRAAPGDHHRPPVDGVPVGHRHAPLHEHVGVGFFPGAQGADTTKIYYVGFLGLWTERKMSAPVTVYETQANLADHEKIQGTDGGMSTPQF